MNRWFAGALWQYFAWFLRILTFVFVTVLAFFGAQSIYNTLTGVPKEPQRPQTQVNQDERFFSFAYKGRVCTETWGLELLEGTIVFREGVFSIVHVTYDEHELPTNGGMYYRTNISTCWEEDDPLLEGKLQMIFQDACQHRSRCIQAKVTISDKTRQIVWEEPHSDPTM